MTKPKIAFTCVHNSCRSQDPTGECDEVFIEVLILQSIDIF